MKYSKSADYYMERFMFAHVGEHVNHCEQSVVHVCRCCYVMRVQYANVYVIVRCACAWYVLQIMLEDKVHLNLRCAKLTDRSVTWSYNIMYPLTSSKFGILCSNPFTDKYR